MIRNGTRETWSSAAGWALGWQLYDPDGDHFLAEGEWRPLAADVAPGATLEIDWDAELPPETGPCRVYAGAVHPERGWAYAQGAPFLCVDARLAPDSAEVVRVRSATLRRLRWSRRLRAVGGAAAAPFATMVRHRALITSLVRRDLAARYRGSFADLFWTVLNPLLLMAAYYFVFGLVLRARFAADPSPSGFVLYFLAGMLPWLAFNEAAARSPNLFLEQRNLVKKIRFPIETLPPHAVTGGLVTQAFATLIFLGFLVWARGAVPLSSLWVLALLPAQFLLTLGFSFALSTLGVFVRDLVQIIGFLLNLWFFLTPICYPEASLPAGAWVFLKWNPLLHLVRGYRAALLEHRAPPADVLLALYVCGFAALLAGYFLFHRLRRSFADVL